MQNKLATKEGQPGGAALNHVMQENIQTIIQHRQRANRQRTLQERIADRITTFSGSIIFVLLHIVWFAAWFLINTGRLGLKPFDPYPFSFLTIMVSLEAIFLSTFVLISQNRISRQDQERAELDLQISLLTERELTRVLRMLDEIQGRLGMPNDEDRELAELKQETRPAEILKEIERSGVNEPGKRSSG